MARLLVYTPTYGDGPQPETLRSVAAQQFDGELVHVVDRDNPYPGRDMRNVTAKYQRARQMVLDDGYDALLTYEHDMQIDAADTVQRMMDTPAPVVYAPYLLRHGSNVLSTWQWTGGKNLGMSLTLYPKELAKLRKTGAGRVCGVGFGCTLMRRVVLEQIGFRGPDDAAPDLPFAMDCIKAGIPAWGRFDIECGHYHDGEWLWPWRQTEDRMIGRIYMLQNVTVSVDGQSMPLKRGRYYSLPGSTRDDLIRAGYATPSPEDDASARETATETFMGERETAVAPAQMTVKKRRPRKAK